MASVDLTRIRALTFDCYGTLIDWESGILSQLRPWADRNGVSADDEALLSLHAEIEHGVEASEPGRRYPDVLNAVLDEMAARLHVTASREDRDAFAGSVGDWPPFPDTPDALRDLQSRYKLLILSNVDRDSFARTARHLGVEFDAVITAEDVGSYKPNHGHFLRAFETLERLGITRDEILHVAQSLYHDHVPAQQLGITSAWIDRRGKQPGSGATPTPDVAVQPDMTFPDMATFAASCRASFAGRRGDG